MKLRYHFLNWLFLHPAAETFRADDGAFVQAAHDDLVLVAGFDLEGDLAVFDGNHLRAARPDMIQAKIKPWGRKG